MIKNRRPLLAGLLSLAVPGLGQLYNGQLKKAVVMFGFLILLACMFFLLKFTFWILPIGLIIMLINSLISIGDAIRSAFKLKSVQLKPYQKGYIYLIVIAIQIGASQIIEINHLLGFRAFQVDGVSMQNTLSTNDQLIVDTRAGRLSAGDVVVYRQEDRFYIHRIVAVPGDTVSITGNQLFINGENKTEPYVSNEDYWREMDELVVPSNHYFMLGDNRGNSADSRLLGAIPANRVIGKALYIYNSDDRSKFGKKIS